MLTDIANAMILAGGVGAGMILVGLGAIVRHHWRSDPDELG